MDQKERKTENLRTLLSPFSETLSLFFKFIRSILFVLASCVVDFGDQPYIKMIIVTGYREPTCLGWKQVFVTSKEVTLKILKGVVTKIFGKHLNLDIESAITKCNIHQYCIFIMSRPILNSQAVDYTLNIGLVLSFLEFNNVLIL